MRRWAPGSRTQHFAANSRQKQATVISSRLLTSEEHSPTTKAHMEVFEPMLEVRFVVCCPITFSQAKTTDLQTMYNYTYIVMRNLMVSERIAPPSTCWTQASTARTSPHLDCTATHSQTPDSYTSLTRTQCPSASSCCSHN